MGRPVVIGGTGGTGFLGRHVCARGQVGVRVDRGDVDLLDPRALAERYVDAGVEAVVHLAAVYRRDHAPEDVVALVDANVRLGAVQLEAASLAGLPLVLADSPHAWSGADGDTALNLYGATRQALAALSDWYVHARDLAVVRLLLPDSYGPEDPRPKLIPALLAARASGTPIPLGDTPGAVDPVHVHDVADAVLHACTVPPGVYRVSSGRRLSPVALALALEEAGGRPVPHTVVAGGPPVVFPSVPDLPGFVPAIALRDGLAALCAER